MRHLHRGALHRGPAHRGDPARDRAHAVADQAGVAAHHDHRLERHRELVGRDLGQGRLVPLALGADPQVHEHGAVRIHADVRALERPDAGALHVRAEPEADGPVAPAPLRLLGPPAGVVERDEEPLEGLRIIGRVVGDRGAVAVGEPGGARHLVGADQVPPPQLGGVHADPARRAIQQPVEHEGGLGPAGAPIGGREGLVGEDVPADPAVVRHVVRPGQVVDGVQRDGLAEHRGGAVIAGERGVDGHDAAVALEPDPHVVDLVAIPRGGEAVLAARLGPLHRASEAPGHHRHQDLLGIDVALHAEAAAHVGHEHADALLLQAYHRRDAAAHREGHLRGGPHREAAPDRIRRGQHPARLERHPGHARVGQARGHDHLRAGHRALGMALGAGGHRDQVVGPRLVDARGAGRDRRLRRERGGQRFVGHRHALGAIGGDVGVVGDHDRDDLAHVARPLPCHDRMHVRPALRLGHQRRHVRGGQLRQVVERPHRGHAGQRAGRAAVDRHHAGVGVGAPHQDRVEQIRHAHVVEIAAVAGDEAAVFLPLR